MNDDDFAIMLEGIKLRNVKLERLNLDYNKFTNKSLDNFIKLIESELVSRIYFYDCDDIFTEVQKSHLRKISQPLNVNLSFVNPLDRPASPTFFQDKYTIALNQKLEEKKDFSLNPDQFPDQSTHKPIK